MDSDEQLSKVPWVTNDGCQDGFTGLGDDKSFSQKMRAKFKAAIAKDRRLEEDWS